MSELLPCPFCGKRMNEENFFSCDGYPKACGCWETTHTAEEAMTVWNTRPIEDALQKRAEELEMNIKEAVKEIELEWLHGVAGADGNRDDVYQSGAGKVLDILRKHGLMEDK